MGCDIHSQAERRVNGKWERIDDLLPFGWRSYGMFGFLANVRNYSAVPPISEPRNLPGDAVQDNDSYLGDHSFSWLSVDELATFDYDRPVEDRRVRRELASNFTSGACTAGPGDGQMTTFRDFLGPAFFAEIEKLKTAGAERVVFGFDS